jgi:hypothetical protein
VYPGVGSVTVVARAAGPVPIAAGATTEWSYAFAVTGGAAAGTGPSAGNDGLAWTGADIAVPLGIAAALLLLGAALALVRRRRRA